jgi:hypothetical protein
LTSYKLANFVSKHIEKSQPDLIANDDNVQEIEQAIISGTGQNRSGSIGTKTEICSRRWLRRLGFSWKEVRKGIFIDGHKRPGVVGYRK